MISARWLTCKNCDRRWNMAPPFWTGDRGRQWSGIMQIHQRNRNSKVHLRQEMLWLLRFSIQNDSCLWTSCHTEPLLILTGMLQLSRNFKLHWVVFDDIGRSRMFCYCTTTHSHMSVTRPQTRSENSDRQHWNIRLTTWTGTVQLPSLW